MQFPDFERELKLLAEGYEIVVGCDEVGAGPVAGPVVACACILDPKNIEANGWHARVRDSKKVTEKEREILAPLIIKNSIAHGLGIVAVEEIDKINIHNASLLAMHKAVQDLQSKVKFAGKTFLLIDGKFSIPSIGIGQEAVIKGDSTILSIAAASIIAKVHRDAIMKTTHEKFPEYGFAKHKGYGTPAHMAAIKKFGMTVVHRKTFLKNLT